MARRLSLLAGFVVLLSVALCTAFDVIPDGGASYRVALQYGALRTEGWHTPGIGMSDFQYRGSAHADVDVSGNYLIVRGSYARLTGSILPEVATGIHIHHDPALDHLSTLIGAVDNTGGVDGTFEGAVYLTPEQQAMLVENRLYLDIHTAAFPEGEMRGWIVAAEPPLPTTASP